MPAATTAVPYVTPQLPMPGVTVSPSAIDAQLDHYITQFNKQYAQFNVMQYLRHVSINTKGVVHINTYRSGLPHLVGRDGSMVPLYEFVEALDGHLSYPDLHEEYPMLTLGQIGSAIEFLRRLSQFNVPGDNLDQAEDEFLASPEFMEAIEEALADTEVNLVRTVE